MIAMGANLPADGAAPAATLDAAMRHIAEISRASVALSPYYRTPAFPPGSGPDFINAAAAIRVSGPPEALMARLHAIEAAFGRNRQVRWGPRTLDLDLIGFGDLVLPDAGTHARWRALDAAAQQVQTPDRLILPHPRMQDRAFVLVPLADVAPDWRHPVLGRTVREMVAALPEAARAEVIALPNQRL